MKLVILVLMATFNMNFLYAHGGGASGEGHHHHDEISIDEGDAIERAEQEITRLVKKGKLTEIWNKAEIITAKKHLFKGRNEWMLTFKNKKDLKQLYIFLTLSGKFLAANFTGK